MPYYKCISCGEKMCGWGVKGVCSRCGGKFKEISEKEFYSPVQPCGTITQTKDFFKFKSENIGVFPKPEIERKDNTKQKQKGGN